MCLCLRRPAGFASPPAKGLATEASIGPKGQGLDTPCSGLRQHAPHPHPGLSLEEELSRGLEMAQPLRGHGPVSSGTETPQGRGFCVWHRPKTTEAVDVRMWGSWGSGGGSHKQSRLPAGGGWQLEAGERTGLIRRMRDFPEDKTVPQMLSSAIWTRDSVFTRPRGRWPQLPAQHPVDLNSVTL